MHLFVEFENPRAAYGLADYLNIIGIGCEVKASGQKAAIYLQRADDLPRAQQELQAYVQNPMDKKYLSASWEQQATDKPLAMDKVYNQKGEGGLSWSKTGIFTKVVIGLCALVFLITAFGTDRQMVRYFFFFTYWGQMFDITQAWRWISPVFLHFGFLHFAFNLLWWWDIGSMIERFQGATRLAYLFLVLAIVPNFAQFLWAGNRFGGLSGVVYGVLAYVWIYGRLRKNYPLQLRPVIIYMMVGWMLIGFSGALDNVVGAMANQAHLAGLVAGALLGAFFALKDKALNEGKKK